MKPNQAFLCLLPVQAENVSTRIFE